MVSNKSPRLHNLAILPIVQENQSVAFSGVAPHGDAFPQGSASDCKTQEAAEWLSVHRDELSDPIILAVRDRFDLTNLQAIEALRRGRVLRHARAN